jgi:hypothetical protein
MTAKGFVIPKSGSVLTLVLMVLTLIPGCSKREPEELITLRGRVEKVRRTSDSAGELTVRFFSDKQNKEIVGLAFVTPETRIEKNGATATFQDIQEGVQVNGQVRSVKQDGQRRFNAVLIQIEASAPTSGG